MPIAEIQSEWVADLLQGRAALPPEPQMNREIARYRAMTAKRYARSTRDTIQVDFLAYRREIRRERRMGARRVAGGHPPRRPRRQEPVAADGSLVEDHASEAAPVGCGPG